MWPSTNAFTYHPVTDTIDMTAFNTDGFDVSGNNLWIHDCSIWNQDVAIAVGYTVQHEAFLASHQTGHLSPTLGPLGQGWLV